MQLPRSKVLAIVCGGTFLGLSSVAAANIDTVDNEMLAMSGEFEVGDHETHLIASHKQDEQYRICVHKSRLSVPLKVIYDGKEDTISNGCTDFTAMNIKVEPAGKLSPDVVLFGKYERVHG
ncbi:MAG: hypothetical protein PVJ33_16170 [Lysobacterales bacterium]|jgi:hypothetical protein